MYHKIALTTYSTNSDSLWNTKCNYASAKLFGNAVPIIIKMWIFLPQNSFSNYEYSNTLTLTSACCGPNLHFFNFSSFPSFKKLERVSNCFSATKYWSLVEGKHWQNMLYNNSEVNSSLHYTWWHKKNRNTRTIRSPIDWQSVDRPLPSKELDNTAALSLSISVSCSLPCTIELRIRPTSNAQERSMSASHVQSALSTLKKLLVFHYTPKVNL